MPQQSFESLPSPVFVAVDQGPLLEHAPGCADAVQALRILARRSYACSPGQLFRAWTTRAAWEHWMRLRARSRASIAAYQGGAFRLELAEGPTIHVVTGVVLTLNEPDHLRLSWQHSRANGRTSTVDVTIRPRLERTELALTHTDIASRRDAAWHMRLWTTVLRRLGDHLAAQPAQSPRPTRRMLRLVTSESVVQRTSSQS